MMMMMYIYICVCVCLVLKYDVTSDGKIYLNCGGPFCIDIQIVTVKNCNAATLKMKVVNFSETSGIFGP
jgi:hypothetical protein